MIDAADLTALCQRTLRIPDSATRLQTWNIEKGEWEYHDAQLFAREYLRLRASAARDACVWSCDNSRYHESWGTACGDEFQFEADGPIKNGMKFCCYCGGMLSEALAKMDGEQT